MSFRPLSPPTPVHRVARWKWDLDKAALLLRQLRVSTTGVGEGGRPRESDRVGVGEGKRQRVGDLTVDELIAQAEAAVSRKPKLNPNPT